MARNHLVGTPKIPNKHYFTIGEVSKFFSIEPHVLRYWEQEFEELKPVRRRGKRRYYTRREFELVGTIVDLLYNMEFTISGARKQLKNRKREPTLNNDEIQAEITEAVGQLNKALNILSPS